MKSQNSILDHFKTNTGIFGFILELGMAINGFLEERVLWEGNSEEKDDVSPESLSKVLYFIATMADHLLYAGTWHMRLSFVG